MLLGFAGVAVLQPSPPGRGMAITATAPTITRTPVTFQGTGGVALRGMLDLPADADGRGTYRGVVVVPGFGATSRDGVLTGSILTDPLYRDLGEVLVREGFVVLRYDKRGAGQNTAAAADAPLRFEQRVEDARAAVAYLRHRPDVDPGTVALIGHDEGGMIGLRVADGLNLGSLVLISTPGRPFHEVLVEAYRDVGDEAHDEEGRKLEQAVASLLRTGVLPEIDHPGRLLRAILPPGQDRYLRGLFSFNPVAAAARVTSPVLIVHGGKDPNIHAETDVEPLRAALTAAPRVDVLKATDAGHNLQVVREGSGGHGQMSSSATRRDREALRNVARWLKTHAGEAT